MNELAALIQRAIAGDDEARATLVQRFGRMASTCARAILGDYQLAEDACQEAFVDAFRKLPQLRVPERFPGWLRSIVRTQCSRLTRGWHPRTTDMDAARPLASAAADPAVRAEEAELRAKVREALAGLPEPNRTTARLFYFDGFGHQEIASLTGAPVGTVKRRLYDARQRLRQRIEKAFTELWIEKRDPS